MCKKCEQQKLLEETRHRLMEAAIHNPQPCVVCGEINVVGAGTWVPDEKHYLAAGGTIDRVPIFAFCLCETHAEPTKPNEKLVTQAVLRQIRTRQLRKG